MKKSRWVVLMFWVAVRGVLAEDYRPVPVGNAESQFMQRQLALEARQQVLEKRLQQLQAKPLHRDEPAYNASEEDALHRMHPRHIEIRKAPTPSVVSPPGLSYPITPVIPFYPPQR